MFLWVLYSEYSVMRIELQPRFIFIVSAKLRERPWTHLNVSGKNPTQNPTQSLRKKDDEWLEGVLK